MFAPVDANSPAPGTGFDRVKHNTALQGHVAFFDPDGDGIIWPSDTFFGFRALTFGFFLSLLSAIIVHGGFSYVTWGSILPDPLFCLKIKCMHRHGSDSEAYTYTGEFDENRFNYVFDMYSKPPHTHLTSAETIRMVRGNRNPFDLYGWFAAAFEWLATYLLLWPADGSMKRDDIKAVYDGSIFYVISKRKPKD